MTRDGDYGPPPTDPGQVHDWLADNDLLTTMRRRRLVVRRTWWHTRAHTRLPLHQQIAVDPQGTLRRLAVLVADELRSTGHAVHIPSQQLTMRDRLTPLSAVGTVFAGAMAGVLVIAAVVLVVWQVTA